MHHVHSEERGKPAPWRRCRIVAFNGSKHAEVEVEDVGLVEIKIGYVLSQPKWGSPTLASLHPFRVEHLPWLSGKAASL
jgi:hypothetical protein